MELTPTRTRSSVITHPSASLTVRDLAVPTHPWNAFVERCPQATLYHDGRWKQVMEESFSHPTFYLIAEENGEAVGVLPLVLVRSCFWGRQLVSLPFLDVAGVCATSQPAVDALWNKATELAKEHNAHRIELRHSTPCHLNLPALEHKVTMHVSLPDSSSAQWKSLDAKVRNQVRKAEKSGVTVEVGGVDLLDRFYRVFTHNMRDLGSPTHSRKFFHSILTVFGEQARLYLGAYNGATIAGALSLTFKNTTAVPWASSLQAYRSLCPNMLLYWAMIRDACDAPAPKNAEAPCGHALRVNADTLSASLGQVEAMNAANGANGSVLLAPLDRRFDFGRSSVGSGTYRFKKQWGAQPFPLTWQYWMANGQHHALRPEDDFSRPGPKRALLEMIWKRFPLHLANWLGPRLRQHIPY
jgi:FemAB-related protein (PEP-CTERM system-associated)